MAPTNDCSATATPRWLITAVAVLFVLRVVAGLAAMATPAPTGSTIAWRKPTAFESLPPKQDKLTVYEFYADWSDPCKRMDNSALANKQIKELIDEKFVPIRITDRAKEDGRNTELVAALEKRYHVFALPTMIVVRSDGEPVSSLIGCCTSLTTYRFLSRVLHDPKLAKAP